MRTLVHSIPFHVVYIYAVLFAFVQQYASHGGCYQPRCSRSTLPDVSTHPTNLMLAVLRRMHRPGQSQDDVIRRSAGLPFAVATLFHAETRRPQQVPTHHGMQFCTHY